MGMAVLVCKNGKWDYDSTATAEANKCDEEGATKTDSTSMMGMTMKTTYVCEKGQWKLDLSGFGGDWTPGDSSGTGFKWNFGDSTGTGFNWDFGDSSGTGFNFGDSSFTLPGGNGGNWDIRPVVKDTTAAP